jgi:myo-inositol-1(or 4)-monophosphatase
VAQQAAYAGGAVIRAFFGYPIPQRSEENADGRLLIHRLAEEAIIAKIERSFPRHNISSDVSGFVNKGSASLWVLAPLDGASNFFLQIPHVAVCVSLVEGANVTLTVIFQPLLAMIYSATRHGGANMNGVGLRVHQHASSLLESTVSLVVEEGFADQYRVSRFTTNLRDHTHRLLMNWTPSLDWCMLASGVTDGLVSLSGHAMNTDAATLAGAFLFQEAGGHIGDLTGRVLEEGFSHKSVIAATSPSRLEEIGSILNLPVRRTFG